MVRKNKIFVQWEIEHFSYITHNFCLFHCVNAKFTLEVLIHFNEVCRVACVLDNDFNEACINFFIG